MDRRHALRVLGGGLLALSGCAGGGRETGSVAAPRTGNGPAEADGAAADPPTFLAYSDREVTLRIDPRWYGTGMGASPDDTRNAGGSRLVVVTRQYPRGAVLARAISRPFAFDGADPSRIRFRLAPVVDEPTGFAHHVAERIPTAGLDVDRPERRIRIAETDRFRFDSDGDVAAAPHPAHVGPRTGSTVERRPEEGHYRIDITGSTGRRVSVRVFKSEYVAATTQSRPDGYRPYVKAAIESGLAERVASRIRWKVTREEGTDAAPLPVAIDTVQSLAYLPEHVARGADEYVKFPAETLVDGGGDCEDTAVLLAAVLQSSPFERRCAIVHPPNHAGVGVAGDGFAGTYYQREGTRYFYVETTNPGWAIGELPERYANETALVFPVD